MIAPRSPTGQPSHLGLMAKHWVAGRVKTRLGVSIGMDAAAAMHQLFFDELTTRLCHVADSRWVVGTPPQARESMLAAAGAGQGGPAWGGPAWGWDDQSDGDLGDRMATWFAARLRNASAAILIGADCPTLGMGDIDDALDRLRDADVVLGPAVDGGYYLIGLAATVGPDRWRRLFEGVQWSSPETMTQTLEAAGAVDLNVQQLPLRRDVDDHDDLMALLARLDHSDHPRDPALAVEIRKRLRR